MVRRRFLPLYSRSASSAVVWPVSVVLALACSALAFSQAITISSKPVETTDRRYSQIEPTKVDLPKQPLDARGHQDILRTLLAEQGFAMRPLPRGKKGLSLAANGKLTPTGNSYLSEITENGLSVKPGDRVVLSNVRIDKERIVFDINNGPDRKHEFLRHIQIGMGGPDMTAPVIQDQGEGEPTGARITLTFSKFVPEITPAQIKALLSPLISFDMKTPVQAYTDTLPPKLKEAILNHRVMVGMSTDMVLFAMGQPEAKSREMDGQMPFEEWIYGHPPQDVNFVRVNGNRVIRVEIAKLGQPLEIFTKDEVEGLMTTDGHPVMAQTRETRPIELGDVHRDPDTQAPAPPPTLRAPGEKLPTDQTKAGSSTDPSLNREGPMKPVIFPKDTSNDPARTVPAHPASAQTNPPADPSKPAAAKPDAAKPDPSKPDASKPATPSAGQAPAPPAVAKPEPASPPSPQPSSTPPASNFYPGSQEPASL
jgi:hypothetical protein